VNLDGAAVLVTGASSGIGAALVPKLAARGAVVGLVARRADRLEAVLAECREHTPGSRMWTADLANPARVEEVALAAWDAFGGLDCLVNNAGIPARVPVTELTPERVAHVMDVNFHAPVRMSLALLARMLDRGRGEIVNVSSLGGRLGIAHEAAYCASKFALCGWSEAMAIDLAGTPLVVKLVLPGPIETEIWDQPGNAPALYDGPLVPATDCADAIVAAITTEGFEFYTPEEGPFGSQRDVVIGKTQDPDSFLALMVDLARDAD